MAFRQNGIAIFLIFWVEFGPITPFAPLIPTRLEQKGRSARVGFPTQAPLWWRKGGDGVAGPMRSDDQRGRRYGPRVVETVTGRATQVETVVGICPPETKWIYKRSYL